MVTVGALSRGQSHSLDDYSILFRVQHEGHQKSHEVGSLSLTEHPVEFELETFNSKCNALTCSASSKTITYLLL